MLLLKDVMYKNEDCGTWQFMRIAILINLVISASYGMTEECIERGVCTSIAKSIEPMVDPKDCQTQFKCGNSSNVDNHWDRHGEARALSISSIKRIIQTKSIRRPKDWYKSKYCHKCERKRSKCFNYYAFTYVLCGGAYLISGRGFTSSACNIITIPRTVDCVLNTLLNCYLKDCGLIGF